LEAQKNKIMKSIIHKIDKEIKEQKKILEKEVHRETIFEIEGVIAGLEIAKEIIKNYQINGSTEK